MTRTAPPTRQALLEAAAALLREAGSPSEVTIRRIIDAAGANLNAVNYHFGSKENLVREAVRTLIGEYYAGKGLAPGSSGPGLLANLERICDFLFDRPVAAACALKSEVAAQGAGPSLTSETLTALVDMLRHELPGLTEAELRFRAWALTAVIHHLLLRPVGCREWLGADPRDPAQRSALLEQLCRLLGVEGPERGAHGARKPAPRGRRKKGSAHGAA